MFVFINIVIITIFMFATNARLDKLEKKIIELDKK